MTTGKVIGIVSNLVTVLTDGPVAENELCYINLKGTDLLAEVIKVNGVFLPSDEYLFLNTPPFFHNYILIANT